MMAGYRGQRGDNSYFSSLLKLWELDDADVDGKLLLETASSRSLLNHSNTCTVELGSSIHESTLSATVESIKSDVEDASISGIGTGKHYVLSHSIADSTLVCSACEHCNEVGSHWCSECGRALIQNSLDTDDATSNFDYSREESASLSRAPAQDRTRQGFPISSIPANCGDSELGFDPLQKALLLSDNSGLRSIVTVAEPLGHDPLKLNSQCAKPLSGLGHSSRDSDMTLQKPRDSFDASEMQLVNHAVQAVRCTPCRYSTTGTAKAVQSQRSPRNLSTCTPAYICLTPGLSQITSNDDEPLEPSSQNIKETNQGCKSFHVYQRRWNTSSAYMWRKPTTLRSKVLSPSATHSPMLHNAGSTFQSKKEVCCLLTDSSSNSHSKCNESSSAIPNRSESQLQTPCTALINSTSEINVPSKLKLEPTVSFLSLPDELLLMVLSFLGVAQLVSCLRVCRRLSRIAADSSLWRHIIFNGRQLCLSEKVLQTAAKRRPKSVVFSHCKTTISAKQCQEFFRTLSVSLQRLRIDTCDFGSQTGDTILTTAVLHCPNLTSIDISWTQLSDRALRFAVEHCKRLEAVSLEQTPEISHGPLRLLVKQHKRSLITLKIKGKLNFVNSTFETAVKLCEQVPNLSTFAVTCTTVEEEHIQRLVAFQGLTDLELQCTSITEAAARCLSQMPLESLILTSLLPLSATCLSHISGMETLRHFSTSSIDDSGIQAP